jgi:pimeloyl-ACP methyl ester carboxylesterase
VAGPTDTRLLAGTPGTGEAGSLSIVPTTPAPGRDLTVAGWTANDGVFVWIHLPVDQMARGGVLICPPLGPEYNWTYSTLRLLAKELAEQGFAVVRFDYSGTGQSAGDLTRAWPKRGLLDSIDQGAAVLREVGIDRMSIVGMRVGGTAAATWATGHHALDALVLWDPSSSGQSFLREQRALHMLRRTTAAESEGDLSSTEKSVGGVEIPGFVYPPEGVVELRRLKIVATDPPAAKRLLIVHRPSGLGRTSRGLIEGSAGEALVVEGIEDMLVVGKIPTSAVRQVVDWFVAISPPASTPVHFPTLDSELHVGSAYDGRTIRERVIQLGPLGLFGIETFVEDHSTPGPAQLDSGPNPPGPVGDDLTGAGLDHQAGQRSPTVIFLDVAAEPCIGPSRLWVTTSRSLALSGIHAVRYNSSGLGDSPARPGQRRDVIYAPEAISDAVEVAQHLEPGDPTQVVLVGQCSGAYNALEAGLRLKASGVCAINPILDGEFSDVMDLVADERKVAVPRRSWTRRLSRHPLGDRLRFLVPELGWHLLDRARIVLSPSRGIEPLVLAGTDVLLVCGNDDGRRFTNRGGWITRKLVRTGQFRFELVAGLDHAMLLNDQQQAVRTLLLEHILLRFDTEPLGRRTGAGVSALPES